MKKILVMASWMAALPAVAQTPAPPALPTPPVPFNVDFAAITEGLPIDSRPTEKAGDKPLFPQQTRAPYHKSMSYTATILTSTLQAPWALAVLPDNKLLVNERLPGTFRIIDQNGVTSAPLTGLSGLTTMPKLGLLDIAIDPQFSRNHRFFFTYFGWDDKTVGAVCIASAVLDEKTGAITGLKTIFRAAPLLPNDQNLAMGTKTGGRIAIGKDGYLYVTIGDRDNAGPKPWGVAQILDTHLGKTIRITKEGKPAPGNPFLKTPGALPEIWNYGQRSQEGLAFNPADGSLWETEHGARGGDELNMMQAGKNYGWPLVTHGIDYARQPVNDGASSKPGLEEPAYYWSPSMAPAGLAFYQGDLFPAWKGSIFVPMLRGKSLVRLQLASGKVVAEEPLLTELNARIRDVRVGPDGAVYVLTDSGGSAINDNTPPTSKLVKLTPK